MARWLKAEGDPVASGDLLVEIETDKATMEVEAVDEGILGRILVPAGTAGVAVNQPIALLLEEGEDPAALDEGAPAAAAPPAPPEAADASPPPPADPRPDTEEPEATQGQGRIFASPLARRLAAEAHLDLRTVTGSGPHGRIIRNDVEAALAKGPSSRTAPASHSPKASQAAPASQASQAAPAVPTASAALPQAPHRLVPHTTMRRVIARRLTESKQTVPHFYLSVDIEMDALLALRQRLNAHLEDGGRISVNDMIIKAVALALRKVPEANASWHDDGLVFWENVDIAVAVATPGGLVTPVVREADRKGLGAIAAEVRALAARAREGRLMPEEYQGGGFSISNLGMYGVREFSAIINPPQACLLAVGAAEPRPVVRDHGLAVATVMTCTVSVDHRVVDGAVGAQFLGAFKALIQAPETMLL
ncbi:acetyltransferase component of pyruvate dehydrogenase complex [Pararhodospirillum oryzae]|uniref:Acetyltransferase component of pyruvate dehydrogenase complex n=1 Tax=Pararhodospirillum oryzae TaxID=478448 RepID=A0A512HB90_9PROT|nr:acetyltransferase component of pyruvate dehydrogenase complex [Pararhodospirillum oryzae]